MTPQVALDRIAALCDDAEAGDYPTLPAKVFVRTVRKVLADVAPEPSCTLTPEEAALAAEAVRSYRVRNDVSEVRALAARLEATR